MSGLNMKPLTIEFGWGEFDNKKDAQAYARGVISQRFMAHEESWYAVYPFHGGYLWEAHQGGSGKSHVKSAAKAMEMEPGGQHWFPAGERAYMIVMQDGKPFPHLLPVDLSLEILNGGTEPLSADTAMLPYIKKGTKWMVTGISMATMSSIFFLGSVAFYAVAYDPGPSVRATDISNMPHMQYNRVAKTAIEEIVEKLELVNSTNWQVKTRSHKVEGLDYLRNQRMLLERENRERDNREDMARQSQDRIELEQIKNAAQPIEADNPEIEPSLGVEGNDDGPSMNAPSIPVEIPTQQPENSEINQ